MCYELHFKSQKPAQDKQADKAAPVIERVPAAKTPTQRQPVTQTKDKQGIEAELETTATA
jgi:hypothetical protein